MDVSIRQIDSVFERSHLVTIFRIPVQVDASFLLLCPILLVFSYQYLARTIVHPNGIRSLTISVVATVLFIACVVLHELGHAAAAIRYGLRIRSMRFFVFGGLTSIEGTSLNFAAQELAIALAGPAVTLTIGVLLLSISTLGSVKTDFTLLTSFIGRINFLLALLNLIPVFPFDGGRALRAFLWKRYSDYDRATQNVRVFANVVSYGSILIGLSICGLYSFMWGVILVLIGWRLRSLLSSEGRSDSDTES